MKVKSYTAVLPVLLAVTCAAATATAQSSTKINDEWADFETSSVSASLEKETAKPTLSGYTLVPTAGQGFLGFSGANLNGESVTSSGIFGVSVVIPIDAKLSLRTGVEMARVDTSYSETVVFQSNPSQIRNIRVNATNDYVVIPAQIQTQLLPLVYARGGVNFAVLSATAEKSTAGVGVQADTYDVGSLEVWPQAGIGLNVPLNKQVGLGVDLGYTRGLTDTLPDVKGVQYVEGMGLTGQVTIEL